MNSLTLLSDDRGRLVRVDSSELTLYLDLDLDVAVFDGESIRVPSGTKVGVPLGLLPADLLSALTSNMGETFSRSMRDCSQLANDERVLLQFSRGRLAD